MNLDRLIKLGRVTPILREDYTGLVYVTGFHRKKDSRKRGSWTLKTPRFAHPSPRFAGWAEANPVKARAILKSHGVPIPTYLEEKANAAEEAQSAPAEAQPQE